MNKKLFVTVHAGKADRIRHLFPDFDVVGKGALLRGEKYDLIILAATFYGLGAPQNKHYNSWIERELIPALKDGGEMIDITKRNYEYVEGVGDE